MAYYQPQQQSGKICLSKRIKPFSTYFLSGVLDPDPFLRSGDLDLQIQKDLCYKQISKMRMLIKPGVQVQSCKAFDHLYKKTRFIIHCVFIQPIDAEEQNKINLHIEEYNICSYLLEPKKSLIIYLLL